jgi:hypothetical protein
MIEGVIANVIAFNADIVAAGLAAYTGGPNNVAVFAVKIPRNCKTLAVRVQSISTDTFDTQGKIGFIARMDVSVYGPKEYSYIPLRALGMLIYKALHRAHLLPYIDSAGYTVVSCFAKAPFDHEDDEGYPASVVSVTATVLEK